MHRTRTTRTTRQRRRTTGRTYARHVKKGLGIALGATLSSLVKLGWEHVLRHHGL